MQRIDTIALLWLLVLSGVTFLAFGWDKWCASRGSMRLSERSLILLGALGGWIGGWCAMRLFRHKTIKASFRIRYALALIPFVGELSLWLYYR